jgi:hypothetical protein
VEEIPVIPAQAGIQRRAASAVIRLMSALPRVTLDPRLRGDDGFKYDPFD